MKKRPASDPARQKWLLAVVEILDRLKGRKQLAPGYRDFEVMAPFDGSPSPIFVWFICDTRGNRDEFRQRALPWAKAMLIREMKKSGFSVDAAEALECDATSQEDIEKGGGRFAFFR